MADDKNTKAGADKAPASNVTNVRMMLKDKTIIEKGTDVSKYPAEKLKEWSEKGFLGEAKDKK